MDEKHQTTNEPPISSTSGNTPLYAATGTSQKRGFFLSVLLGIAISLLYLAGILGEHTLSLILPWGSLASNVGFPLFFIGYALYLYRYHPKLITPKSALGLASVAVFFPTWIEICLITGISISPLGVFTLFTATCCLSFLCTFVFSKKINEEKSPDDTPLLDGKITGRATFWFALSAFIFAVSPALFLIIPSIPLALLANVPTVAIFSIFTTACSFGFLFILVGDLNTGMIKIPKKLILFGSLGLLLPLYTFAASPTNSMMVFAILLPISIVISACFFLALNHSLRKDLLGDEISPSRRAAILELKKNKLFNRTTYRLLSRAYSSALQPIPSAIQATHSTASNPPPLKPHTAEYTPHQFNQIKDNYKKSSPIATQIYQGLEEAGLLSEENFNQAQILKHLKLIDTYKTHVGCLFAIFSYSDIVGVIERLKKVDLFTSENHDKLLNNAPSAASLSTALFVLETEILQGQEVKTEDRQAYYEPFFSHAFHSYELRKAMSELKKVGFFNLAEFTHQEGHNLLNQLGITAAQQKIKQTPSAISALQQAGFLDSPKFSKEERLAHCQFLIQNPDCQQILIPFTKAQFFANCTKDEALKYYRAVIEIHKAYPCSNNVVHPIEKLRDKGLLKDQNLQGLIQNSQHIKFICEGINTLTGYNLLTQDTYNLLIKSPEHAAKLAGEIVRLHFAGLLFEASKMPNPRIFNFLENFPHCIHGLTQVLDELKEIKFFPDEKSCFDKMEELLTQQYITGLANSFLQLQSIEYYLPGIHAFLIKHAQHTQDLAIAIDGLNKRRYRRRIYMLLRYPETAGAVVELMRGEIFADLKNHKRLVRKVADIKTFSKILKKLNDADPPLLTQGNFNLLIKYQGWSQEILQAIEEKGKPSLEPDNSYEKTPPIRQDIREEKSSPLDQDKLEEILRTIYVNNYFLQKQLSKDPNTTDALQGDYPGVNKEAFLKKKGVLKTLQEKKGTPPNLYRFLPTIGSIYEEEKPPEGNNLFPDIIPNNFTKISSVEELNEFVANLKVLGLELEEKPNSLDVLKAYQQACRQAFLARKQPPDEKTITEAYDMLRWRLETPESLPFSWQVIGQVQFEEIKLTPPMKQNLSEQAEPLVEEKTPQSPAQLPKHLLEQLSKLLPDQNEPQPEQSEPESVMDQPD